MEIERKYLIDIDTLPEDYQNYPCRHIEQAYLNTQLQAKHLYLL